MTTWNSRGLRGAGLEELINRTNEKYLEKGLALIQKIPTPITPINIDQTSRHITLAYFDKKSTVDAAEFEGLASIPLSVEGVKIGITVKQRHENVFKISVRSDDEIDASAFCREFGGGGHIRAAGCEITGSLEEVKAKLLKQAEKVLG